MNADRKSKIVLLVGNLTCLREWLDHPDFVFLTAPGARDATRFALGVTPRPDAVFLSLNLEDGNGHDTCMRLRQNLGASLPIFLVSARRREIDRQYAEMLGASGFLAAISREQFLDDLSMPELTDMVSDKK